MTENTEWLSNEEAAAEARERGRRCTASYLAKLRCLGKGPRFYLRDGRVAYKRVDIEAWAEIPRIRGPFTKASEAIPARRLEAVA